MIRRSLYQLLLWTAVTLDCGGIVVLPRPGCGNGKLDWADVRPVVEEVLCGPVTYASGARSLGDRFVIVERNTNQPGGRT